MTRLRTVVLGYQGFGNVGDEAILTGAEQLLAGTDIEVSAVVCGPDAVAGFPSARRIRTRRLRPTMAAMRALRKAQLLLLPGGGLLHDHWPTVMPLYLGWVLLARLHGTRVAWLGVGVGPLRSRRARWMAGRALRASSLVTVRDAESAEVVRGVAPGIGVAIVPDPAVFNTPPADAERRGIGLIVRGPTPGDEKRAGPMAEALGGAAAELARSGRGPVLMTFGGMGDRVFAEAVAGRAELAGAAPMPIEELTPDPVATLARLAGFEAVVSVRLHGLILAAIAGTPAATIAYDPKVASWAARLGADEASVPLEQVSPEAILQALDRCVSVETTSRVAARLAELRGEGGRVRELLAGIA
jgi:polysaccharide pyruvyl transferase WcaK-like protein